MQCIAYAMFTNINIYTLNSDQVNQKMSQRFGLTLKVTNLTTTSNEKIMQAKTGFG